MTDPTRLVFEIATRGSIEAVWGEINKTDEPRGAIFGCRDRSVRVADRRDWSVRPAIAAGPNMVVRLACSPDGTRLLSTAMKGTSAVIDCRPMRVR